MISTEPRDHIGRSIDMHETVEPGCVEIMVGTGSAKARSAALTVA